MLFNKKNTAKTALYVFAMALGALCFIAVYGVRVLNPCYDAWLFGRGDLTQHYLGWCFYRISDWTFPPGLTDRLAYPDYSSIIYTDSIPIFAMFFKLLSPILPETFQYFGWWGIACFMLQGLFAAKILDKFNVGKVRILIGSIIFILSPVVIEKMFRHTALGGHWIILLSIYLFACHKDSYRDIKKTSFWWGFVGAYIGCVHMYFLPMCGAFACGFVLCSFFCNIFKEKKISLKYLLPGISFAFCLFASAYLCGGFSTRTDAGSNDLGKFSFNLNGFFNAKGYSKFLPALETYRDGQYEGFAYLGIGVFILIAISAIYLSANARGRRRVKKIRACGDFIIYGTVYMLMSIGLIMFAASPDVTFGNRLLFVLTDSSTLTHYWGMFRSSGRIIWPVCYLIYTGVIVCNDRFWNKKHAAALALAACAFLQIFDISGKLKSQRMAFAYEAAYESPLKSDVWTRLSDSNSKRERFKHIIWVSQNFENNDIMNLAKYAYDNGLTMNNYYFARGINVNENTKKSLENLDKSCIYVFDSETVIGGNAYCVVNPQDYPLNLYEADGYTVGIVESID